MLRCKWMALTACGLVCLARGASAQEWTRFRGPNGAGVSDCKTIPASWTDADYNWKVELPGVGHSSPVLWGDKIFLISANEENARRYVFCVSAKDGGIVWSREYDSTLHGKHKFNSFASATPTVDGERVYVAWSSPQEYAVLAFDHNGTEVWRRNLGEFVSQHSCGTSPVVYEDLLLIANEQGDEAHNGRSSLIALDRATGETRWETPRKTEVVAYSTPCVYQPAGGPAELIFNGGSHGIASINPKDGKVNWELDVLDKRSVSSPIIASGLIFGTTGSGKGGNYLAAVRPGDTASGKAPVEAYKVNSEAAPYVPTPVALGDLVFLWSDAGVVACLEAGNGKEVWRKRIGGSFHGSPVCVDGRLYCVESDEGNVVVISASKTFELLGEMPLGEECRSTPAVAGGRMYLRTRSHLFSIGGK